jgi:hypothetical protein
LIKKYKNDELELHCNVCGFTIQHTLPMDFTFNFSTEFNEYEPHGVECENCKVNNKKTLIYLNPNIPIGEYEEFELEALAHMHDSEINARKFLRDLIWDKRPDLFGKDRNEHNIPGLTIIEQVKKQYQNTPYWKLS